MINFHGPSIGRKAVRAVLLAPPRGPFHARRAMELGPFACAACTYANDAPGAVACVMCGAPRGSTEAPAAVSRADALLSAQLAASPEPAPEPEPEPEPKPDPEPEPELEPLRVKAKRTVKVGGGAARGRAAESVSAAGLRSSADHLRSSFVMLQDFTDVVEVSPDVLQRMEEETTEAERLATEAEAEDAAEPEPEVEEGVPPVNTTLSRGGAKVKLTRIYREHGITHHDPAIVLEKWIAKHGEGTEPDLLAEVEKKYKSQKRKKPKLRETPTIHVPETPISPKVASSPPKCEPKKQKPYKPAEADKELAKVIEQVRCEGGTGGQSFEDIVGIDVEKNRLRKAVNYPIIRPDFYKPNPHTGAPRLLDPYKGILLYGPPGTGKTTLAKAVAAQCKCTFFSIDASTLGSKWKGDSANLARLLFDMARTYSPSVIFFDEIDKTLQGEHESSQQVRGVVQTEMDGVREDTDKFVLVIGATNYPWKIDSALLSRHQLKIYVPLPGEVGIRQMLEQNMRVADDVDLSILASRLAAQGQNLSGRDIVGLCQQATGNAFLRWEGGQSEEEMLTVRLSGVGDACVVTTEDIAQVVEHAHGSAGVTREDWQRYVDWAAGKMAA